MPLERATSHCLLIVLFVGSGLNVHAASDEAVLLQGATVISGKGGPALENTDICIIAERITFVGPTGTGKTPEGARVIDYRGKTIIPGLISVHSHVGQVDGTENSGVNYNPENILRQLRQHEVYGVTTVVALGLNGPLFYKLRPELHAGKLPGADLFGADRGIGVAGGAPPAQALSLKEGQLDRPETPDEARAAVQAAKARGTDLIKLWLDDFRGSLPIKMKPEIYVAVIDEAHRQGLRVAAHVFYLQDAKDLVKAGVDIIAHGVRDQPVDEEFIELMKSKSVWYVATLALDEANYVYSDHPEWLQDVFFTHALQPELRAQFESAEWRAKTLMNPKLKDSREAVKQNQQNLIALYRAGVLIGFGTDSGATPVRIPGFAEHRELQLMCEAGFTPVEAIAVATSHAAKLLHLEDRGVLADGKLADLVVLEADPSRDISNTNRIESVWHRGKQVSKQVTTFTP